MYYSGEAASMAAVADIYVDKLNEFALHIVSLKKLYGEFVYSFLYVSNSSSLHVLWWRWRAGGIVVLVIETLMLLFGSQLVIWNSLATHLCSTSTSAGQLRCVEDAALYSDLQMIPLRTYVEECRDFD